MVPTRLAADIVRALEDVGVGAGPGGRHDSGWLAIVALLRVPVGVQPHQAQGAERG